MIPLPECESDGRFKAVQCSEVAFTKICWCVDETSGLALKIRGSGQIVKAKDPSSLNCNQVNKRYSPTSEGTPYFRPPPAAGTFYMLQVHFTCCRHILHVAGRFYMLQTYFTCCRDILHVAGTLYMLHGRMQANFYNYGNSGSMHA